MIARCKAFIFGLALVGVPSSVLSQMPSSGPVRLLPHIAVYDLDLLESSQRSSVSDMTGRIVYEFTGSECEGYSVNFRFVTRVDSDGENRVTDQWTTTYESPEAGQFVFETKSYAGGDLTDEVRGEAQLDQGTLDVTIYAPETQDVELAESLFPTRHMVELINLAKKGEHFFQARIFDGSEKGDEALFTAATIGDPVQGAHRIAHLSGQRHWPVTIAYFDDDTSDDKMPIYRMSFDLYENGVNADIVLDYGDFSLAGKLVKLEMREQSACN